MLWKIALALAVAYAGWWLWQGPKRVHTSGKRKPARSDDELAALATLGLDPGAGIDEIRSAHRRLLRNVHPDHGGTADLTRRVNDARDTLLKPRLDLPRDGD